MELPTNFDSTRATSKVTALVRRNMYGLPYAPSVYMKGLQSHLRDHGFLKLRKDRNIYTQRDGPGVFFMTVAMDDYCCS